MGQVLQRMRQDWERLACERAASKAALLRLCRAFRESARKARVRGAALQGELALARQRAQRGGDSRAAAEVAGAAAEHLAALEEVLGALLASCNGALQPQLHQGRPGSKGGSSPGGGGKAQAELARGAQVRFKRLQRAVAWLSQLLARSKLVLAA
jgi:hypothetical protein